VQVAALGIGDGRIKEDQAPGCAIDATRSLTRRGVEKIDEEAHAVMVAGKAEKRNPECCEGGGEIRIGGDTGVVDEIASEKDQVGGRKRRSREVEHCFKRLSGLLSKQRAGRVGNEVHVADLQQPQAVG